MSGAVSGMRVNSRQGTTRTHGAELPSVSLPVWQNDAYPRAIRTEPGKRLRHRANQCRQTRLEQDRRDIKSRCQPMLGFKSTVSAGRYCRGTANSETLSAAGHACANMFRQLRAAFATCIALRALGIREAA